MDKKEEQTIKIELADLLKYMDDHGLRTREVTKDLVFILERKVEDGNDLFKTR